VQAEAFWIYKSVLSSSTNIYKNIITKYSHILIYDSGILNDLSQMYAKKISLYQGMQKQAKMSGCQVMRLENFCRKPIAHSRPVFYEHRLISLTAGW